MHPRLLQGSKLAFAGYFTPHTLKLVEGNQEKLDDRTASHYYSKFGFVAPKYLRKFAFDTLISEKLCVPESVADFIQGMIPKRVGARHYTKLLRQADGYYVKYADYLDKIRDAVN
jgi:intergrase/recombinase